MTEAAAATDTDTDTARRSSTNSAAASGTLGSLNHVCPICSNRYERADYLKRHLASREHLFFLPCSPGYSTLTHDPRQTRMLASTFVHDVDVGLTESMP